MQIQDLVTNVTELSCLSEVSYLRPGSRVCLSTPWIHALMVPDLRVIETNLCYWHMRTKCFDFLGAILQIRETEQKVHL